MTLPRKLSSTGTRVLVQREALRTAVYLDSGGEPTIGIGHLLTKSERASGKLWIRGVAYKYSAGLPEALCYELLDQDLMPVCECVDNAVAVPLTQSQFDALVIFTYNVGNAAFEGSTLLKRLNAGAYAEVPTQLQRWVHDNGKYVPGLLARRMAEVALWNGTAGTEPSQPVQTAAAPFRVLYRSTAPANALEVQAVMRVQRALRSVELYDGKIDGWAGSGTSAAFRELTGFYLQGDPRGERA